MEGGGKVCVWPMLARPPPPDPLQVWKARGNGGDINSPIPKPRKQVILLPSLLMHAHEVWQREQMF